MRRVAFGGLFFAWLYGVPFLFVVALVRRTSAPYLPTDAAARDFAATTDALFNGFLMLNAALPALGLILAAVADEPGWRRHFGWATAWMVVVYLAYGFVSAAASTPLIGHVPPDLQPDPPVTTHCVQLSGGQPRCPGG